MQSEYQYLIVGVMMLLDCFLMGLLSNNALELHYNDDLGLQSHDARGLHSNAALGLPSNDSL